MVSWSPFLFVQSMDEIRIQDAEKNTAWAQYLTVGDLRESATAIIDGSIAKWKPLVRKTCDRSQAVERLLPRRFRAKIERNSRDFECWDLHVSTRWPISSSGGGGVTKWSMLLWLELWWLWRLHWSLLLGSFGERMDRPRDNTGPPAAGILHTTKRLFQTNPLQPTNSRRRNSVPARV